MTRFWAILLTVFCSTLYGMHTVRAQTPRQQIDSLNTRAFDGLFINLDQAALDAGRAAKLSQQHNYARGLGRSFTRLGIYYDLRGSLDSAVLLLNLAINILERERDTVELSIAYNNLGIVHYERYDYDKAIHYYKKSMEQDRLAGDIRGVAGGLQNIGILYTYKDSLHLAEKLYAEAEQIYRGLNDSLNLPIVLSNQAKVYTLRGDFTQAMRTLKLAEAILPKENTDESRITIFISLSNALSELGQNDEALQYARQALVLSQKIGSKQREQYAYDQLQMVYKGMGDYKNAYTNLLSASVLSDSIYQTETNRSISEMQTKFDVAQKDKDLRRVTLEKEAATHRATAKELGRNFALALAAIALVLAIYAFSVWRSGKKINRLLQEKNKLAVENLEQKEMLIGEIHHRVKNNLQLVGNLLDFQSRAMDDKQAAKSLEDSKNRVASMAMLHQFLYTRGDYRNIDMHTYLNELAIKLQQSYTAVKSEVKLRVQTDDNLKLDIDTAIPIGLIVNELVTNAYKYAFAETDAGEIFICLQQTSAEVLTLKINDNGKGMLLSPETASSFGTQIITSLCRQLRADWQIENDGGTQHTLHIKKFKRNDSAI